MPNLYSSHQNDSRGSLRYYVFAGSAGAVDKTPVFPVGASPDNCVIFDDFLAQTIGGPLCQTVTQSDEEVTGTLNARVERRTQ